MAEFYILVKRGQNAGGQYRAHPHPKSEEGDNDSDATYVASTEVCP